MSTVYRGGTENFSHSRGVSFEKSNKKFIEQIEIND
jgi:hypothetical protein